MRINHDDDDDDDFIESRTNPEESRLRKHLFDPEYQTEDLKTTPVTNVLEIMNVNVSIFIMKLIALVKMKPFCGAFS